MKIRLTGLLGLVLSLLSGAMMDRAVIATWEHQVADQTGFFVMGSIFLVFALLAFADE